MAGCHRGDATAGLYWRLHDWRLHAGGPHQRDLSHSHAEGAFLSPLMTLPTSSKLVKKHWKPNFVDCPF